MPQENRSETGDETLELDRWPDATSGRCPRNRGRWTGRLVILIVIFLALGPVLCLEMPSEVSRWYQAAAMERWIAGDKTEALDYLEDSLRWAPAQADAFVCRGDWRLDEQEFHQAIEDYNAALQREPGHIMALINRSLAFQHLGLHERAIQDWKTLVDLHRSTSASQRAMLLNGLAYAQALGSVELKQALENVSQAIDLVGHNAAMLDTRGYIHLLEGNFEAARADLDPAVAGMEQEFRQLERTRQYIDRAEFERKLTEYRKSLAVIRYHRALALDALARPEEAESDRSRVRELGYTPGPDLF
jgi:tetratricopeptide (TPR) repeat protein